MTIEYDRRIISEPRKINPQGKTLGVLFGGPRTTRIELVPATNPYDDVVKVTASYGSFEIRGPGINTSQICRKYKIRWHA